jgi:CheY-like chemotaxis protein
MRSPLILVYETDPVVRDLFTALLEYEGCAAHILDERLLSSDGIAKAQADLLLLDCLYGEVDWTLAIIEELRCHPATAYLPIVVTSTSPRMLDRLNPALQQNGCTGLLKPFDVDQFLGIIRENLSYGGLVR